MVVPFEVTSNSNRICGELITPDDTRKLPCLILGHGFTGNRNERMLVDISRKLAEGGIASIRFDYNGHGESEGAPENVTVAGELSDLRAVLDYARKSECVDASHIFAGGHSVGGLVPIYLYEQVPEQIEGLVLISPALSLYHEFVEELTGDRLVSMMNGEPVDFGNFRVGRKIIDECSMLNPFETAASMQPEALLIHGKCDRNTPAFNSVLLKKLWGEHAKLCLIEGADHCYMSSKATGEVADQVTRWMQNALN